MSGFDDVITVDGASGAGKSTLLAALARRYGALPVEFGPVVRTVAWLAKSNRMTITDAVALTARLEATGNLSIAEPSSALLAASEVVMQGIPMRQRIFSAMLSEATSATSHDVAAVAWIAGLVRARVRGCRAVLSGRQAATLVCPDAGLRIRLEASPAVRAVRKSQQLAAAGLSPGWSDDLRLLGPPRSADVSIDTTCMAIADVEGVAFRAIEASLRWRAQPTKRMILDEVSESGYVARPHGAMCPYPEALHSL